MTEEKKKTTDIGDLGHCGFFTLPYGYIKRYKKPVYLFAVQDDCTRISWVLPLPEQSPESAAFGLKQCLAQISSRYNVIFKELKTAKQTEFGSKCITPESQMKHPFKKLLLEMYMKHNQVDPSVKTNTNIASFWGTIREIIHVDEVFSSYKDFEDQIFGYSLYYNNQRIHSSLQYDTPAGYLKKLREEKG